MGRLYSGNLNAFKAACNRLYQLDFCVIQQDWYEVHLRKECMRLQVEDRAGNIFALKTFAHRDEDVLYNTATGFLNCLANQLDTWRKIIMTTTIKTNPHRAVDYSESGVKKALEAAGSLEAEVKYDGVRLNLPVFPTGETQWLSRESKELPALSWLSTSAGDNTVVDPRPANASAWRWFLKQAGHEVSGLMIDGEVMVKGVDFNTSSGLIRTMWSDPKNFKWNLNKMASDFTKKSHKVPFQIGAEHIKVVVYGVIDLNVILDQKAEGPIHSVTRLKAEAIVPLLQKYFPEIDWVLSESHTVYDLESLNSLYEQKRLEGHEGLVVKDPLGKYKRGKKSGMWKMKPSEEADGHVVRPAWGTEGLANEGLVIGFDVMLENGMEVSATNISRALMSEFTENVKSDPDYYKGWACQITYMEETPDGSLRHPSFDQWRGTEDNPTVKI